jgi:hypothetical protein
MSETKYSLYETIKGHPRQMRFPNRSRVCLSTYFPQVGQWELIREDGAEGHMHYLCKIKRVFLKRVYLDSERFEVPCTCETEAFEELLRTREKQGINSAI